jgi:hypothetical protein
VYRIETEITSGGSEVEKGEWVLRSWTTRLPTTRQSSTGPLSPEDQIRTVIRTFRDKLLADRTNFVRISPELPAGRYGLDVTKVLAEVGVIGVVRHLLWVGERRPENRHPL